MKKQTYNLFTIIVMIAAVLRITFMTISIPSLIFSDLLVEPDPTGIANNTTTDPSYGTGNNTTSDPSYGTGNNYLDPFGVNPFWNSSNYFPHGSAGEIDGTTIVVSIFASDPYSDWDSSRDAKTIANIKEYLSIAGDYLEDVVSDYGKTATFITDFEANPDLRYDMYFEDQLTDPDYLDYGDIDYDVWEYIYDNIDQSELMTEFNADNVIYMVMVNSDESNEAITCTRNWYDGMPYEYEIIYLYNIDYEEVNCPAVYAHEMLHAFGAPDLYTESEDFRIDEDFLSYVEENMCNDIMLTCTDLSSYEYNYRHVTNEVGEVTAYYVGLTDHSDIVDEWNLRESEHLE